MMKINDNSIGKVFQDSLKDIEVQPDPGLWTSIEQQAGISSSGMSVISKAALYFVGAAVIVSSILIYTSIDNKKDTSLADTIAVNEQIPNETVVLKSNDIETQNIPSEKELITEVQPEKNNTETIDENINPSNPANKTTSVTESNIEKVDPIVEKNIIENETNSLTDNGQMVKEPQLEIFQPKLVEFGETKEYIDNAVDTISAIELSNNDSLNIQFSANPTVCFGEDAVLVVKGGSYFTWNTGANTSKIIVSPVEQSNYWVLVEDANGNEQKHTFTVTVDKECTSVFVPSAFTPNGDGVNDVFKAEGVGVHSFAMVVINKEGQIVYESRSIDDSWDGTYKNGQAIPQMYFYQITYIDAKGNKQKKRGQLTLIK